jgi:acyl carrier protein
LDSLAWHRQKLGLPGTSINWGPWAESGMAAGLSNERFSAQGIRFLEPERGLRILKRVLEEELDQCCVADVDWQTYGDSHHLDSSGNLFAALVSEGNKAAPTAASGSAPRNIAGELRQALPVERRRLLSSFLQELARTVLGYGESETIAPDRPLVDQGFDSLMTVDMRNRLSNCLDCALPASLLFDHPTIERITDHLLQDVLMLGDADGSPAKGAEARGSSAELVLKEIDDLVSS